MRTVHAAADLIDAHLARLALDVVDARGLDSPVADRGGVIEKAGVACPA